MISLLSNLLLSRKTNRLVSFALAALAIAQFGAIRFQPAIKAEHVHGPAAIEEAKPADVELMHDAPVAAPVVSSTIAKTQKSRTIRMQVTAYCPCKRCCGPTAQGLTASGRAISYNGGQFVAADTRVLPFNTKLIIPGYASDKPVQVIDRGGAIKGNHIDLFFPTHDQARQWGVKWVQVTVLE
ncbi:MAG TPA: 3D domain-containing protein [Humisphaera sp.]|jgi:3D (Asp-Asp-Asp) domain-containing protein|nr:3D domain-containing protein [Humisphaera sp.]